MHKAALASLVSDKTAAEQNRSAVFLPTEWPHPKSAPIRLAIAANGWNPPEVLGGSSK